MSAILTFFFAPNLVNGNFFRFHKSISTGTTFAIGDAEILK